MIQFNTGTFTYTALTQLTGTGQYQLTGVATLLGLLDYLPNLKLLGGSVGLSPSYQTNGNIVRLDLDGSALIGTHRVTGLLNLNLGSLAGSVTIASNAVLNWNSGTVTAAGALTVESNGVVNIGAGGTKSVNGAHGQLRNGDLDEWNVLREKQQLGKSGECPESGFVADAR